MTIELFYALALGLMLGSFANVVIHRLPIMMERAWHAECHPDAPREDGPFDLSRPRSHCPHCKATLGVVDLLPVLSFMASRGRCRHCGVAISWRYPLVELTMAALFGGMVWLHGAQWVTVAWCVWAFVLLTAALIDADTTLLPDSLTLPLLWLGLLLASFGVTPVDVTSSVWGAALGYGVLRGTYEAFKLVTGKEGMGFGDFKLLAALGAWAGLPAVMPILLMSSVLGVIYGGWQWATGRLGRDQPMPFGPFLVLAAFIEHLSTALHGPWTLAL